MMVATSILSEETPYRRAKVIRKAIKVYKINFILINISCLACICLYLYIIIAVLSLSIYEKLQLIKSSFKWNAVHSYIQTEGNLEASSIKI